MLDEEVERVDAGGRVQGRITDILIMLDILSSRLARVDRERIGTCVDAAQLEIWRSAAIDILRATDVLLARAPAAPDSP